MERKNIIIASLLMFGVLTAEAQTVKVNETEATANGEMEFVVTADANINNYIATGFFVELPEGFSVAGVEGVKSNAVQSNHMVRLGQTGDSKFRVAVYSLSNSSFDVVGGGVPTLCTLKVKAPNKVGIFTGRLTGVEFANASHVLSKGSELQFTITIKPDGKRGDINGDGNVDNADIITIVGYIMAGEYDEKADLNGDDNVDAADVVELVKCI